MLRKEWGFEYPAGKLSEAAAGKLAFHTERLAFWRNKKDEVMKRIRSEGIEVDEKIALGYRNPKASDWDNGAKVMVRNDLQAELEECMGKLKYHTNLRENYDGWQQALAANSEANFKLDIEDWHFFFARH